MGGLTASGLLAASVSAYALAGEQMAERYSSNPAGAIA